MRQEMILYLNIKIEEKWLCHQIAISKKAGKKKAESYKMLELISIMNIVSHFGQIGCKVS